MRDVSELNVKCLNEGQFARAQSIRNTSSLNLSQIAFRLWRKWNDGLEQKIFREKLASISMKVKFPKC